MKETNIITEDFTLTLQYQMKINTETGEILETKLIKRSVNKANFEVTDTPKKRKVKKEESSEPQLILEDNKYCLNTAAIELIGVNPDDKIDIKYQQNGKKLVPIIASDVVFGTKNGNRLTKTHTVAFRGSKNEELAKFGTVFTLVAHSQEGVFILKGDTDTPEEPETDENINIDDIDLDLSSLVDDNVTEIDANFFKL